MQTTKISGNPIGENGRGDVYASYKSDLSGPIYLRQKTDEGDETVVIPSFTDLAKFIDYVVNEKLRRKLISKIEEADGDLLHRLDALILKNHEDK